MRAAAVSLAVGLVLADSSIAVLALPAIYRELEVELGDLHWALTTFNLALALAAIPAARLTRRAAPAAVFAAGLTVFAIASAACTLAPSFETLVVFRAVQAVGGAASVVAALELLPELVHPRRRALGLWVGAGAAGAALGPAAGGALTETISWQAVFAVQVPLALLPLPFLRGVPVRPAVGSARPGRPGLAPNIALAFLTGYAGSLGAAALAGVGAAVRLEYLMYPVVFGLGATLVAMVGTNVGAGQLARAVRITWIAAGMAVLATGLIGLAAIVWPQAWIALFTAAPEVSEPAAIYLGIAALGYAFIGMNTLTSAFQAMGQTFWPLMGVVSRAAVLGIGGWLVVSVMGGGVIGLAIVTASGLAIGGSIVAVAFWLRMRRKLGGSQ